MMPTRFKTSRYTEWRRGTAEIELMISCAVLITILLICVAAMRYGVARLSATGDASYDAFRNATFDAPPQNVSGAPVDGFSSVRPGLPNRMHTPHDITTFTGPTGDHSDFTAQVGARAATISPAWSYCGYPVAADQSFNSQWFENYVDESHAGLSYPLGLSPPWTP